MSLLAQTGLLQKLTIYKLVKDKGKGGKLEVDGEGFPVMFNPTSIKDTQVVKFNDTPPLGSSKLVRQFASSPPMKMNFDFVIDGTGAAHEPYEEVPDVYKKVLELREITQEYDGAIHEPPWIRLVWGDRQYQGRTTSLSCEYTLFKPSGKPLRANISLEVEISLTPEEEKKEQNKTSPDMTHIVRVRAGDTLPLLCQRVYEDARYYLEVAQHNKIDDFRQLQPGIELHFPPLKKRAARG